MVNDPVHPPATAPAVRVGVQPLVRPLSSTNRRYICSERFGVCAGCVGFDSLYASGDRRLLNPPANLFRWHLIGVFEAHMEAEIPLELRERLAT